ncbi:MAG: metallophosphoesterase [Candidatus Aenigmatarchaeota archaeon]
MQPRFLTGEPALQVGKALVVADLHVGIEYEFRQAGIQVPSQLEPMAERLERLLKLTKASRLIILGDLKHKVPGTSWQELRELPGLYKRLKVKPELVPGNHDGGIGNVIPEMRAHPSQGLLLGDAYLSHGHTWPGEEFLKAKWVVIAHSHPRVEFRDRLGYRWLEPVWLRGKMVKARIEKRYGKAGSLPELIVMPAFNHFAGGVAVNRGLKDQELRGPPIKCMGLQKARAYLLDGTELGEVRKLKV